MRILVIYFSFTGNNARLAQVLARRLGADIEPVVETRQRNGLGILLDMLFDRSPPVRPMSVRLSDYDHVVLVAPIWNMKIAHPLRSAILQQAGNFPAYSFITSCGGGREGQAAAIRDQLTQWVGRAPEAVEELHSADLVPETKRNNVRAVSGHRVSAEDLRYFEPAIARFCTAVRGVPASAIKADKPFTSARSLPG